MNSLVHLSLRIAAGAALGAAALGGTVSSAHAPQAGRGSTFAWADFDADGHRDAFVVAADGTGRLLRGAADGSFEDATASAGLGGLAGATGAAWADLDGDGDLDLFVGRQAESRLFENLGDGRFLDATARLAAPLPARLGERRRRRPRARRGGQRREQRSLRRQPRGPGEPGDRLQPQACLPRADAQPS